jgi:hypothetical protein
VRYWKHLPPLEIFPTPFEREFAARHVRATRRRLLNFELFAEPHVVEARDLGAPLAHPHRFR